MEQSDAKIPTVILHTPLADPTKLDLFVEDCLREGIKLIAVAGPDAEIIEDSIDDLVVGDGSQADRFIVTSSHAGEPLEHVLFFALSWDGRSAVREVRL